MKSWFTRLRNRLQRPQKARAIPRRRLALESLEDRCLLSAGTFLQTNLVSDIPGLANVPDPHLLNPWGITFGPTSPFWVSDNNSGFSTLYNGVGTGAKVPLDVVIPTVTPGSPGSPTGTVFNTLMSDFNVSETVNGVTKTGSSIFLFATEDGLIVGWSPSVDRTHALIAVDNSAAGAGYKGLAIGVDKAGDTLLYAANFVQNTIDVYDKNFNKVTTLQGNFQDPKIPDGFAPFNIQEITGPDGKQKLYVEYAKFDPTTTNGAPGRGAGFVDVYNTDGQLLTPHHLISRGVLNAPWGVALAPANFGEFSNDLLVGNFGNGRINAFDPTTGEFEGRLTLNDGKPFQEDDLWALTFGNGVTGAKNTLFFTAGLNDQADGLFGSLQAVPRITRHDSVLPNLPQAAQQTFPTNAPNGDQNPYGVAFVPKGFEGKGVLNPGDLLVSNFNNKANVQGTGSTIDRIAPNGEHSVFFQGAPGLGLTTALGVLKSGFVIVGSVPTAADGTPQPGSLLILDSNGHLVSQLSDSTLLDGPWDLTINDQGDHAQVFVSNVLSGTVTRIDLNIPDGGTPMVESETQIASGFAHHTDPNALVVGPTGLAFDPERDILYVASTADNAIFAIPDAAVTHHDQGMGRLVFKDDVHLHGPLGLVLAPNGDLITANGDAVNPDPAHPNELVEFTPTGQFVSQFQLDGGAPGAAFGLALSTDNGQLRLAAVDDNVTNKTNTVKVFTFELVHHHHHDFDDGFDS
jgi:uncharacterized protein (TIGR03118 family)